MWPVQTRRDHTTSRRVFREVWSNNATRCRMSRSGSPALSLSSALGLAAGGGQGPSASDQRPTVRPPPCRRSSDGIQGVTRRRAPPGTHPSPPPLPAGRRLACKVTESESSPPSGSDARRSNVFFRPSPPGRPVGWNGQWLDNRSTGLRGLAKMFIAVLKQPRLISYFGGLGGALVALILLLSMISYYFSNIVSDHFDNTCQGVTFDSMSRACIVFHFQTSRQFVALII